MLHAPGYDRDLARQFFRRSLRDIGRHVFHGCGCPEEETDYLAEHLSATAVFGLDARLGSPWCAESPVALANLARHARDRLTLQRAETAANQLLLGEGLLARGLTNLRGESRREDSRNRFRSKLASALYLYASRAGHLTLREQAVLVGLSGGVEQWTKVLALLPGNDYWEELARRETSRIVLPHES